MKVTNQNKTRQGFTLIEMVGVLAIIAILAALLVPKIFAAINESRINNAVASFNSVKAASMSYFAKYGRFAGKAGNDFSVAAGTSGYGTAPTSGNPAADWDNVVLVSEGYLERGLTLRIGTASDVVVAAAEAVATAPGAANAAYDLDGSGAGNEASGGAYVVETTITGAALEDARDLNQRIDGVAANETPVSTNAQNVVTSADLAGRVKYSTTGNTADIRIYVAHK